VETLHGIATDLEPMASYLSTAGAVLPADHDWALRMEQIKEDVLRSLSDPNGERATKFSPGCLAGDDRSEGVLISILIWSCMRGQG